MTENLPATARSTVAADTVFEQLATDRRAGAAVDPSTTAIRPLAKTYPPADEDAQAAIDDQWIRVGLLL